MKPKIRTPTFLIISGKVAKILITGGFGYLGGRLCQQLKFNGHRVIVSTRRSREELTSEHLRICDDIIHLKDKKGNFRSDIDLKGFDIVLHLAALNEVDCVNKPYEAIEINISDTLRVLDLAIDSDVSRFIYLSTFHVYGAGINESIDEDHICRPIHPYSITHKAAEDYVLAANLKGKIKGLCLRLSNAIGAPVIDHSGRWTLLMNDICLQAVRDKKIVLKSAGNQKRDFITLEDFCDAVEFLVKTNEEEAQGGLLNVGSGESYSVEEMTLRVSEICERIFGYKPDISKGEGGEINDNMTFKIDRLTSMGFTPSRNYDKEITGMLTYCKNIQS